MCVLNWVAFSQLINFFLWARFDDGFKSVSKMLKGRCKKDIHL